MHRTIRWLALGAAVFLLAACSHKDKNAPLAYVPADTPYLLANLKPLTDEARAGLMPASASSAQRAAQVAHVRRTADELETRHKPHFAKLLRAFADSVDGRTYAQMEADAGIDPHGLFAVYGLGLSPVIRGQLNDPAKFHAYVDKLEKAYGKPFAKGTLDKVDYRHVTLGTSGLQLMVATHDKQYVVALLSARADQKQLRLALGLDRPAHSVQGSGRLAKLAKNDGYGPYTLGYLDTTKLPALIAGARDPLLHVLADAFADQDKGFDPATMLPASCKGDLTRIAARVPLISAGYTKLEAKEQVQQVDITLAPDIVKAFKDTGTHVPGLGGISDAPLDIALALPVPAFRNFWLSQAEAVAARPFTCPALTSLNKLFANMQKMLPRTAIPPFGDMRGLRLVLDHIDFESLDDLGEHRLPKLSGRLLLASHNPDGLLNLAKAMLPGVAKLDIDDNGKPVALPSRLTAKAGQPAWVAMNDKALALGVGQNEKDALPDMLDADAGQAGTLVRAHMTGKLYVAWLDTLSNNLAQSQAKRVAKHKQTPEISKTAANIQADLAATRAKMKHLKDVATHGHLTDHGIRVTADVRWK